LGCKKGLDSLGHIVFEPRDDMKGDAARCMFYQILCYDGVNSHDWYLPMVIDSSSAMYGQSEALLKKWNQQDPPDNWEIARNDNVYYWQANRNPFIDHPEWVNWFSFGVNSSIGEIDRSMGFSVFPNPAVGSVMVVSENKSDAAFELLDMEGAALKSVSIKANSKNAIDVNSYPSGMYFYRLTGKDGKIKNGKLLISK